MQNYKSTQHACYAGYFVQAIINNLSPVLFIIYQDTFQISYATISFLVLINFITQLLVDISSALFVDKVGYRRCIRFANILSAVGLCMLPILPFYLPPFIGLSIATIIMAIGSGLIEVLISPIVDNLPLGDKASSMSLLHSFYCWGQLTVVAISTVILHFFSLWRILPFLWAIVPIIDFCLFKRVPIEQPPKEERTIGNLFTSKAFLVLLLIMLCSGASELSMSQWASLFAEKALSLPKLWGDLCGPCGFALFMALGRTAYGLWGQKIPIYKSLICCSILCMASYLLAALSPLPVFSLIGCMLCGLSVSLMWPGCFSLSSVIMKNSSTAIFALFAMGGDLGCSVGPWLTGIIANQKIISTGLDGLSLGLLVSVIFPLVLLVGLILLAPKYKEGTSK